jgi:hypothetical protein
LRATDSHFGTLHGVTLPGISLELTFSLARAQNGGIHGPGLDIRGGSRLVSFSLSRVYIGGRRASSILGRHGTPQMTLWLVWHLRCTGNGMPARQTCKLALPESGEVDFPRALQGHGTRHSGRRSGTSESRHRGKFIFMCTLETSPFTRVDCLNTRATREKLTQATGGD